MPRLDAPDDHQSRFLSNMASGELDAFRAEWRREVAQRQQAPAPPAAASHPQSPSSSTSKAAAEASRPPHVPRHTHRTNPRSPSSPIKELPSVATTAIEHFAAGVEAETEGRLPNAVLSYRKAFKLDPRADKSYHAHEVNKSAAAAEQQGGLDQHAGSAGDDSEDALNFRFKRTLQMGPDYTHGGDADSTQGFLESLLDSFVENPYNYPDTEEAPQPLDWLPHDLTSPCRLQRLPDELISHILVSLITPDVQHGTPKVSLLETRAALMCRKARLVSLSNDIWKKACISVFRPPFQLPPLPHRMEDSPLGHEPGDGEQPCEELLMLGKKFRYDWRRCFIEQPRLRTDGAFISVISYLRKGESDMAWVNPSHLITYYRFFRFYPDGRVVSLLTTLPPNEIARSIDLGLRIKGLSVGQWTLRGTTVRCVRMEEPLSAFSHKYFVEMECSLRSTHRGRHNKLVLKHLWTVRREDGAMDEIPLQHNKVFFFSPVRSYEGW